MAMASKIALGIAAVLALLAVFVATRPSRFHVERSVTIAAPPESVFAHVDDFHAWADWSPWEKLDPGMKRTFRGAPSGVGATYAWSGNDKVGEGRMAIEKSEKPSLVSVRLEFLKPFSATNTATFTFAGVAGGTKATWAMDGTNDFVAKAIHLVMDMDKLVGGDFERGLAALKAVAERAPKAETADGK
jgi:uncharacterized protein YndB with AHSA1/START domain